MTTNREGRPLVITGDGSTDLPDVPPNRWEPEDEDSDAVLYTGVRKSDARILGPANIVGDRIRFKQQKTGAEVDVPLHPK